jgi:hypothetical protein
MCQPYHSALSNVHNLTSADKTPKTFHLYPSETYLGGAETRRAVCNLFSVHISQNYILKATGMQTYEGSAAIRTQINKCIFEIYALLGYYAASRLLDS